MIGTQNTGSGSTNTLHLIFTLGVPGIGKSSLINTRRRASQAIPQMAVEVLTADEVRSSILAQEYQSRGLLVENLSQEEIFRIEVEYANKIKIAVNEEASKHFGGYNIERTLMVPDLLASDVSPQRIVGPFSLETILVSLVRGLNRKNHITMNHGSTHVLMSYTGCLGSQIGEPLQAKFPPEQYRYLEVDYYSKDVAREFLSKFPKQDQDRK